MRTCLGCLLKSTQKCSNLLKELKRLSNLKKKLWPKQIIDNFPFLFLDLCEFVFGGTSIRRIKTLSSLFGKKKFGSITLKKLRYGFVRVSDWYRQSLSVRQALYAVDSEVLVRSLLMAIMLR